MTGRAVPRFLDHVRVFGLLVRTLLGVIPAFAWVVASPVLKPWVRARLRRRLERSDACPVGEPPAPDPAAWAGRTIFVVAGEASGDRLAARVVSALRERCPDLRVRGYAGDATRAAGAVLDRDITGDAVVGVVAVVRSLGRWWGLLAATLALWREDPPDALLTVDFPGLNGRLAAWARARGIPAVHLVPPAVWAYAPWRLIRWRRAVDRMLTVFPFEPSIFEGSGIPCVHVGHPLFEAPLAPPRTPASRPERGWVELLPGSRRQEIRAHAGLLLEAAGEIQAAVPGTRFVVRLAEEGHRALFEEAARSARRSPGDVTLAVGGLAGDEDASLLGALAASGTITAELGVGLVPHAVFYRVSPWTRLGALVGLTAPWFGLVNLIARREVAPERLVVAPRGRPVARDFLRLVSSDDAWRTARDALARRVRAPVEVAGVADRAARAVLEAAAYRWGGAGSSAVSPQRPANQAPVGDAATSSRPAGGPS